MFYFTLSVYNNGVISNINTIPTRSLFLLVYCYCHQVEEKTAKAKKKEEPKNINHYTNRNASSLSFQRVNQQEKERKSSVQFSSRLFMTWAVSTALQSVQKSKIHHSSFYQRDDEKKKTLFLHPKNKYGSLPPKVAFANALVFKLNLLEELKRWDDFCFYCLAESPVQSNPIH